MRKTRGQAATKVRRGAARVGQRRNPRNPLTGAVPALRPDPAAAARLAGARGRSAPGVGYVERLGIYQEQNGPPYKLTDRQHRRVQHKLHHQEAQARRAIARRTLLAKLARLIPGGAGDGR